MNRKDKQKDVEKQIFREFVKVCPLKINEESIKSGDEIKKEPDILCRLKDGNELAFELTEAIDSKVPYTMVKAEKAEQFWEEYINTELPKNERERFERIFSGCSLTLNLNDQTTENDIKKAIPRIFERYKNSCRSQLGLIHREVNDLPDCCESIKIEPKDDRNPEFRCFRAMSTSPEIVLERIKSKFSKKPYNIYCPIHLLIYSYYHSLGPDAFWDQPDTKSYIEQNIGGSQFDRIWVFDWHEMKIEYVFPEIDN